ncbi:MAG TPA: PH domain-containing protein [Luteolibacter sp.]
MNVTKTYRAPWGTTLRVTSFVLIVLAVTIPAGLKLLPVTLPLLSAKLAIWGLPLVLLLALPFMIRGYAITPDAILIRRLFWTTRLERARFRSAEVMPRVMATSFRACGNGGGFSFTGWYWNKSLGPFRAFVTDLNRTVVLRFDKRIVVVSPDDPVDFVTELSRA